MSTILAPTMDLARISLVLLLIFPVAQDPSFRARLLDAQNDDARLAVLDEAGRAWAIDELPDKDLRDLALLAREKGWRFPADKLLALVGSGRLAPAASMLVPALADSDSGTRVAAARALANLGAREPAGDLAKLLSHEDPETVSAAASALARLRANDQAPALAAAIKANPTGYVLGPLLEAAGELDEPALLAEILPFLRHEDAMVAASAKRAFARLAPPSRHADLRPLLEDPEVRLRALGLQAVQLCHARSLAADVAKLLQDQDLSIREAACDTLGKLQAADQAKHLVPLLKSTTPAVRKRAIEALGLTRAKELSGELSFLVNDREPYVRMLAATAMGRLGDRDRTGDMIDLLRGPHGKVREVTLGCLIELGPREEILQLTATFKDRRSVGIIVLKEITGAYRYAGELAPFLKSESPAQRDAACDGIGRLGGVEFAPDIAALLKDGQAGVRARAAEALGRLGARDHAEAVAALLTDTEGRVRETAIEALGWMEARDQAKKLLPFLDHGDPWVRSKAALSLGSMGAAEHAADVAKLLSDTVWWVQARALEALGDMGGADQIDRVIPFLGSGQEALQHKAVEVISRLGLKGKLPDLEAYLKRTDADGKVVLADGLLWMGAADQSIALAEVIRKGASMERSRSVDAVIGLAHAPALPAVLAVFDDADGEARAAAIQAAGGLGRREAVKPVLARLRDPYEPARERAAEALGRLGASAHWRKVAALLREENAALRAQAAEALGRMGAHQAAPQLHAALNDQDIQVRARALKALGLLGGPMPKDLTGSPIPEVRAAWADAVGLAGLAEARPQLAVLARDTQSPVRERAVVSLGRIGNTEDLPLILDLFWDPVVTVRQLAAHVAGDLAARLPADDPQRALALKELQGMRRDTSWEVQYSAGIGAARLGGLDDAARRHLIDRISSMGFVTIERIGFDIQFRRLESSQGNPGWTPYGWALCDAFSEAADPAAYAKLREPIELAKPVESAADVAAVLAQAGYKIEGAPEPWGRVPEGLKLSPRELLERAYGEGRFGLKLEGATVRLVARRAAFEAWRPK